MHSTRISHLRVPVNLYHLITYPIVNVNPKITALLRSVTFDNFSLKIKTTSSFGLSIMAAAVVQSAQGRELLTFFVTGLHVEV